MPKDFDDINEQKLNRILRDLDSPEDDVLNEAAFQRVVSKIREIGRENDNPPSEPVERLANQHQIVPLASGDRLGDFVIDRKIAQGGMGIIYAATQEPLGRIVAVKTVLPDRVNDFTLERFRREREILGKLHESNIVSIFSAGTKGEIEYFAMPYISGISIRRLVGIARSAQGQKKLGSIVAEKLFNGTGGRVAKGAQDPKVDDKWNPPRSYFEDVARILVDLADGAQAVHDAGYIHRDITPNNVLIDTNQRPWLIDFGIAATIPQDAASIPSPGIYQQSIDGDIGTPQYKAPELKDQLAGRPTDVFGLGVCMFCLLAGKDFSNDDFFADESASLQQHCSSLPRGLEAVCQKALQWSPEHRYQSPAEFAGDLHRWLRDEPVSSRAYPVRERAALWLKRNPIKSVATAAATLLFVVSISLLSVASNERQKADIWRNNTSLREFTSLLQSGQIENANQFFEDNEHEIQLSPVTEPEVFLAKIQMHIWLGDVENARKEIALARQLTTSGEYLARLTLAEAELNLGFDLDTVQSLATEADETGLLGAVDSHFAKALYATNSVDEQKHLAEVVDAQPYHLRAQQLLVLNLLYLGQKADARMQLSNARVFFPDDLVLECADVLLLGLDGKRGQAVELIERLKQGQSPQIGALLNKVRRAQPDPAKLHNEDFNTMLTEIDRFLVEMYQIHQSPESEVVLLPPALARMLTKLKGWETQFGGKTSPTYWRALENELNSICESYPEGVFLLGKARSLIAQQVPGNWKAERWYQSEHVLERALKSDSMVAIRPVVIQQLAMVRTQTYFLIPQDRESNKIKLIEALELFMTDGLIAQDQTHFHDLLESAVAFEKYSIAAILAERYREFFPNDPDAYGFSAMVALKRDEFLAAHRWASKAIDLDPNHKNHRAQEDFQRKAAEQLRNYVEKLEPDNGQE